MNERLMPWFFLGGSSLYSLAAYQYSFGSILDPKAGFMPLLTGLTAVSLSLLLLIIKQPAEQQATDDIVDWTKFLFVSIGLLFFVILLTTLGYFAAMLIFLIYLFKVADTKGWVIPVALASSVAALSYFLFKVFLNIQLP